MIVWIQYPVTRDRRKTAAVDANDFGRRGPPAPWLWLLLLEVVLGHDMGLYMCIRVGRLRPRDGSGVRVCLRPGPVFNTAPSRLLRADEGLRLQTTPREQQPRKAMVRVVVFCGRS